MILFPVQEQLSPVEVVALPGGCVLSVKQYLRLQGFKENEHVIDW